MHVLILSKTSYGQTQVCVGGMVMGNNRYIRLLKSNGYYQDIDTPLNVGDVWDINFTPKLGLRQPHAEDVLVQSKTLVKRNANISEYIQNSGALIWQGNIEQVFYGKLQWTNWGKGYINQQNCDIEHSVGFWLSDKDITLEGDSYRYVTDSGENRYVKYKGLVEPPTLIPANTLIRLSLAKWWDANGDEEERCYMQLSGWYD